MMKRYERFDLDTLTWIPDEPTQVIRNVFSVNHDLHMLTLDRGDIGSSQVISWRVVVEPALEYKSIMGPRDQLWKPCNLPSVTEQKILDFLKNMPLDFQLRTPHWVYRLAR